MDKNKPTHFNFVSLLWMQRQVLVSIQQKKKKKMGACFLMKKNKNKDFGHNYTLLIIFGTWPSQCTQLDICALTIISDHFFVPFCFTSFLDSEIYIYIYIYGPRMHFTLCYVVPWPFGTLTVEFQPWWSAQYNKIIPKRKEYLPLLYANFGRWPGPNLEKERVD